MRILDDGTVEIRNKRTGDTKIIQPQDLPSYGIPYTTYQTELGAYKESIKGEKVPEKATAPAAKDMALGKTGIDRTKEAAKLFEKDPLVLTKQLLPGKYASRDWDRTMYDAADALLRLRTGAQANPSEIKGYMQRIAPSFGDSPEIVENKLNGMLEDFAAYSGDKPERIKINKKSAGGLLNFLLGNAIKTVQDVGTGMAVEGSGLQESQQGALRSIGNLQRRSVGEQDPEQKRRLLELAGQVSQTVGQGAEETAGQFSPDIQKGVLGRSLGTGLNVATTAGLASGVLNKLLPTSTRAIAPKVAPDLSQRVVNTAEKVRQLSPSNILGQKQAQAAAQTVGQVTPKVNKIIKAGEKLAQTDPDVAAQVAKNAPKIANIKDVPTLLERMQVWGRSAYKTGGGIKAGAKSELYKEYYKAGLDILKTQAPEVYKQRQLLRLTFELPKAFGKTLWRATLGKVLIS